MTLKFNVSGPNSQTFSAGASCYCSIFTMASTEDPTHLLITIHKIKSAHQDNL